MVGRRCVDFRRAEGVQAAAAALHRQEGLHSRRRVASASLFSTQPQSQQTARSGAAAKVASVRRTPGAASGRTAEPNSRQRRSALRSASRHAQLQVQVFTAPLSPSCTSVGCDGGAGCGETWPTLSHSRTRRTTTTLASRLGSCPRRQVSWRRLARGDETALHHLPPLLRLRVPPVRAVLHCLGGSIKPSVHLHCSRQVGRESSRERWCPRHRTPVACDACATSPTLLASASTGK